MEELIKIGLRVPQTGEPIRRRVELPLIKGGHPAAPGQELTPERVADILLQQDLDALG